MPLVIIKHFCFYVGFDNRNLKVYVECLDDDLTTLGGDDGGSDKNIDIGGGGDNISVDDKNTDLNGDDITLVGLIRVGVRIRVMLKLRVRVRGHLLIWRGLKE